IVCDAFFMQRPVPPPMLRCNSPETGAWQSGSDPETMPQCWRRSEAAERLKVGQIDLSSRTILLSRYSTKNGKPKRLQMTQEVYELVSACIVGKKPEETAITREDGSPVGDFRKAWWALCISVGLGRKSCRKCDEATTESTCKCGSRDLKYDGLLVHDLRRTSVRNLRRLGFAEKTIMEISGHKTAAIFRRYDITDEADLAEVAAELDQKHLSQLSHISAPNVRKSEREAAEIDRIQ